MKVFYLLDRLTSNIMGNMQSGYEEEYISIQALFNTVQKYNLNSLSGKSSCLHDHDFP